MSSIEIGFPPPETADRSHLPRCYRVEQMPNILVGAPEDKQVFVVIKGNWVELCVSRTRRGECRPLTELTPEDIFFDCDEANKYARACHDDSGCQSEKCGWTTLTERDDGPRKWNAKELLASVDNLLRTYGQKP